MCERYFILRYDRTPEHSARDCGGNQLILEPGIFIEPVASNLVQLEIVKIGALIVIAQDRAAAPTGIATAIFILQTIPQRDKSQPAHRRDLNRKPDRTRAFTGAAPYKLSRTLLDRKKDVRGGCEQVG